MIDGLISMLISIAICLYCSYPDIVYGFVFLLRGHLRSTYTYISRDYLRIYILSSVPIIILGLVFYITGNEHIFYMFRRAHSPFIGYTLSICYICLSLLRHTKCKFNPATDSLYCQTLFTATYSLLLFIAIEPITPVLHIVLLDEYVFIHSFIFFKFFLFSMSCMSCECLWKLLAYRNDSAALAKSLDICNVRIYRIQSGLIFTTLAYCFCMVIGLDSI